VPTPSETIAGIPFFALLDDAERATLAERLDLVQATAGTILWQRNDPGDALYVITRGVVEMWVDNDTGERLLLETARAGDFFGEVSLLDGGPRTATAEVKEDMEALVVDRGDLDEFLRLRPAAAMDILTQVGKRLRESALILRRSASRNVNDESADNRTRVMKVADWISKFSGSLEFLFIHIVIFFVWIVLNVGPLRRASFGGFDPFPFGLLTMVVSLEAIILSVFVLLSQNRQAERDRVRNEIEYSVNLRAELEVAHLHEKFDQMNGILIGRIDNIERSIRPKAPNTTSS
jgi:CRP/FNR family cyclic AMP-dependent transcriptional regulator